MKKIASVKFKNGTSSSRYQKYFFLVDRDDLRENDLVVVDTKNGFTVASFSDYEDEDATNGIVPMKWIVEKLDLTAHTERLEKQKRMIEIKQKMDSRKKNLQEIHILALLAKEDDEMASLLKEYMDLKGTGEN